MASKGYRPALTLVWALALTLALAGPAAALRSNESEVEVPNLRGKRLVEAERILNQAGFERIQVYDVDTDKRGLANVVKEQSPLPGRSVPVSTPIKLTVYRYD